MRCRLYGIVAAALAGCATDGVKPAPEVVSAQVTVTIPCVTEIPTRPDLLAEQEWSKEPDPDMRARVLKVDRRRLLDHVKDLEATLEGCKTQR
jgi:hypothetical protein